MTAPPTGPLLGGELPEAAAEPTAELIAEPTAADEPGLGRRALTSLRRDPVALISVLAVIVLALVAIFAPLLAPHNPLQAYPNGLSADGAPVSPGSTFLLGTDPNGRDVLSRLIFGARVSLLVGVVATGLASAIGVLVGAVAGYAGGIVDSVLMRITDVVLSFPILLFCVALIAITGPSTRNVMLVIAFGYWTYLARIVRGLVLSLKEREFVVAARDPRHRAPRDPAAAHPPAPGPGDHRLLDPRHRDLDPHRGLAVLPRHRRAAAAGVLGPDDLPGPAVLPDRALAAHRPRGGPGPDRPRLQPGGGLADRPA